MVKIGRFDAKLALAALALAAGMALPGMASPALAQAASQRDAGAEAFIGANSQKVLGVLNDRRLSADARHAQFHALIEQLIDWPRLTRFVLGKYARTITPEQFQRFATAFRTYAEGVYQRRIEDYRGDNAAVSGSVIRKPGDVIVLTRLSGPGSPPTDLSWRVLSGPGGWKIADAQVKGVWLAITEQQDFVSTIDNAGGKVDVLTAQLEQGGERKH